MASYRLNHVHISKVAYQLMAQVSVRGFLEPPLPKHVLGCYSSFVTLVEKVGASTDFWALAHHLKGRLDRSILEGFPLSFVTFATQLADVFNRRSAQNLFSLQVHDSEKWPEKLGDGDLRLMDCFESHSAGGFGIQCCLGLAHHSLGSTLSITANTSSMDEQHAANLLNYLVETLEANTGVEVEPHIRSGATSQKGSEAKSRKPKPRSSEKNANP
jgi:hypothetical protein